MEISFDSSKQEEEMGKEDEEERGRLDFLISFSNFLLSHNQVKLSAVIFIVIIFSLI